MFGPCWLTSFPLCTLFFISYNISYGTFGIAYGDLTSISCTMRSSSEAKFDAGRV
jgi:hypothetical protein